MSDEQEITAYVIIGTVGEYSDRSEWSVCWTPNEEEAKSLVVRLNRASQIWFAIYDHYEHPKPTFDENWKWFYTGPAEYYYSKAPGAYLTFDGLDEFEAEHADKLIEEDE